VFYIIFQSTFEETYVSDDLLVASICIMFGNKEILIFEYFIYSFCNNNSDRSSCFTERSDDEAKK
jgi:hypothetical protein